MALFNKLELIGRGYKYTGKTISEFNLNDNLMKTKDYVFIGVGIQQVGACRRDENIPSQYDYFFDTIEEAEIFMGDMTNVGYGNTITSPVFLFEEVIKA